YRTDIPDMSPCSMPAASTWTDVTPVAERLRSTSPRTRAAVPTSSVPDSVRTAAPPIPRRISTRTGDGAEQAASRSVAFAASESPRAASYIAAGGSRAAPRRRLDQDVYWRLSESDDPFEAGSGFTAVSPRRQRCPDPRRKVIGITGSARGL